jgi:hypothetical protein
VPGDLLYLAPYSFGLSATSQQYFSLKINQPPATNQQYFSFRTNQHQPPEQAVGPKLHMMLLPASFFFFRIEGFHSNKTMQVTIISCCIL